MDSDFLNLKKQIKYIDESYTKKFCDILFESFSKLGVWHSKVIKVHTKLQNGLNYNYEQFIPFLNQIIEQMKKSITMICNTIQNSFQQLKQNIENEIQNLEKFNNQFEHLFSIENFNQNKILTYSYDFYNSFNEYKKIIGHDNQIISKIILQNNCIIVASFDKTLSIWNKNLKELQRTVELHQSWIRVLQLYSNNQKMYLLSGGDDLKFCIFSINEDKDCILTLEKELQSFSYSRQAFVIDNYIYSSGGQRQNYDILQTDLITNELVQKYSFHKNMLINLKILIQLNILQSTDIQGYSVRWYLNKKKIVYFKKFNQLSCCDHNENFNCFGTETGKILITNNKYKILRIIKLQKQKVSHICQCDKQHVIAICKPDYFFIYNIYTNQILKKIKLPEIDEITAMCIDIFQGILILGDKRGKIFLYEFQVYLSIK